MALGTQTVAAGSGTASVIVGKDAGNNIAPGHVLVGNDGTEKGIVGNALQVATAGSTTSTTKSVNAVTTATAGNILGANTSRQRYVLTNDSTAVAYVLEGAGIASATNYTFQLTAAQPYSTTEWQGAVSAAWGSANGAMRVTEQTA